MVRGFGPNIGSTVYIVYNNSVQGGSEDYLVIPLPACLFFACDETYLVEAAQCNPDLIVPLTFGDCARVGNIALTY